MIDIARVTYDASRKAYLSADPVVENDPVLVSTWDEASRTFTTRLPDNASGQTRINTATFTAEDRIDWKTVTRNARGKVVDSKRGSYVRTAKSVPAIQLPPATATTSVAFAPTGGGRELKTETIDNTDFFKLRELGPFRAKIVAMEIQEKFISATLEGVDLRTYVIRHESGHDWDKALAIAKRLTVGTTHEFPAALADDYQPPAADFVAQPTTDAMRALAPFIGHWRMHWTKTGAGHAPKGEITLHYFWSHDGTGLWREVLLPPSVITKNSERTRGRSRVEAVLTTYDPVTQRYSEADSPAPVPTEPNRVEWDAKTQTYSFPERPDTTNPDIHFSSMRRIVSPDRIEFSSKAVKKSDGSLQHEGGGFYERITP